MRGLFLIALFAMTLYTAWAADGPDSWLVGRWRAELSDGDTRELVLDANGRFSEARAASRRSHDGGAHASSSASARSGSWRTEGGSLVLNDERRSFERATASDGAPRLRLDGVEFERVEK